MNCAVFLRENDIKKVNTALGNEINVELLVLM